MKPPNEWGGLPPLKDELIDINHQNLDSLTKFRCNGEKPPLLIGLPPLESRLTYEAALCRGPAVVSTIGRRIFFNPDRFGHAFYKSSPGHYKDLFDPLRAERIYWISAILSDPMAEVRLGYLKREDRYLQDHRVFFWPKEKYLVVVRLHPVRIDRAKFVTAYPLSGPNAEKASRKILCSPHG